MSDVNVLCEACGNGTGTYEVASGPADVLGALICNHCSCEIGAQVAWDAIRARRSTPRFVDRNGVETRIGDRVRVAHGVTGVLKYFNDPSDVDGNASILRDDGDTGAGTDDLWLAAWKYIERIDPPADEGKVVEHDDYAWNVTSSSRDSLVAALLRESGSPQPIDGYGDFERDRVTRMVDAQAAMLGKLERDMELLGMLGPMFAVTPGDCEGTS